MNILGASFVTEEFKRDDGTQVGGKTPRYIAKPAINSKYGSIALVVTGNYAAIKDNHDHNTMLKARG